MAEYTRKFSVVSGSTASHVIPFTETSSITLGDLVIVVPKDYNQTLDRVSVYFYTAGSYGGFSPTPSRSTRADIPEELYKGKRFFAFRPSDFFEEGEIHGTLRITGDTISDTVPEQPMLRFELDEGAYIDKEQWANIDLTEDVTLTTDTGIAITNFSFVRYQGNWNALDFDLDEFKTRSHDLGAKSTPYTFNFSELFSRFMHDDIFIVLRVETGIAEEEPDPVDPVDPDPVDPEPEPEPEPIILPLTKDFKGAYIEPNLVEVSDAEDSNITIHSDHLHYLTLVEITKSYPEGEQIVEVALEDDRQETITLDLAVYLDGDLIGIELKVRAEKLKTEIFYTYDYDEDDMNPASVFNATVHPPYRSLVNGDTTLVITADEGLIFNDGVEFEIRLPQELWSGSVSNPKKEEEYSIYPEDERYSSYFNEDKTVIRIPLADFWIDDYYTYPPRRVVINNVRATEKNLSDGFVTSYATTYKMSRQSLDTFSEAILNISDFSFMNSVYNRVHSLFMIPFKLPNELLSSEPAKITRYNEGSNAIDAEAHYTLDNKYILPLGAIEVKGEYGNVYDYKGTTAYLHSPYIGQPVSIDLSYVIDETITLNMAIDLYSGNATLNIHSSKIEGELVQRVNIPIKHEIPLMSNNNNIIEGKIGGFIYNKITTPFIEVVRDIPYENDSMFGKGMSEYGRVGDFSGYVEMADTNVLTDATTAEQDMIKSELSSGVIIRPKP